MATEECKITKKMGSFDGHFTSRFSITASQKKKRRGNLLQEGSVYFSKEGDYGLSKGADREIITS
jgi:hypothetical protein